MKSLASLAAVLAAAPLATSSSIVAARDSCALVDGTPLCPSCDGGNATDSLGHSWSVSCDWVANAEREQALQGVTSLRNCLDACDDADDCFAVNFASNGSCVIIGGEQQGLRSSAGFTNLVRSATHTGSPVKSTSTVSITQTMTDPKATQASSATATATGLSGSCNLGEADLCPKCNGLVAVDSNDKGYRVLCDTSIDSNGSYSVQEWLSPAECLEECDKLNFCTGATYYDERSCELAKANPSARYDESNTAFFPLFTANSAPATTQSKSSSRTQGWNVTTATPTAGPTVSTLPISSGCNPSAVTCPECDGMPILDKLNGSYTVSCNIKITCDSLANHRDPGTQDLCLESCDAGATCLAALWYPDTKGCELCMQGIASAVPWEDSPYALFLADVDGDTDSGDASLSVASAVPSTSSQRPNATSSLTQSITNLRTPFPSSNVTTTNVGPVGTVSVASTPTVTGVSAGSAQLTSSNVPSIANVTCPTNDDVYLNSNGDYFAVGCDSRFDGAHSSFFSASNIAACAASCTGPCDGVQFGALNHRCGLFTDISLVGPATGWTVAASVTFPAATGIPGTITSVNSFSSPLPVVPKITSFTTSRTNGTVSRASSGVTRAPPSPVAYAPPAYNPL